MKSLPVRLMKIALGFIALAFCAAPVPGDVGGCAQDPQPLDPTTFLLSEQRVECDHCRSCEIDTAACTRACGEVLVQSDLPSGCAALVHDGEVCLRALDDGSCSDFRAYMSDSEPTIPTECNFCPAGGQP